SLREPWMFDAVTQRVVHRRVDEQRLASVSGRRGAVADDGSDCGDTGNLPDVGVELRGPGRVRREQEGRAVRGRQIARIGGAGATGAGDRTMTTAPDKPMRIARSAHAARRARSCARTQNATSATSCILPAETTPATSGHHPRRCGVTTPGPIDGNVGF